jgi:hypothetical protein
MEIREGWGQYTNGEEVREKGKEVLNIGFCTGPLKFKKLLVTLEGVQENYLLVRNLGF